MKKIFALAMLAAVAACKPEPPVEEAAQENPAPQKTQAAPKPSNPVQVARSRKPSKERMAELMTASDGLSEGEREAMDKLDDFVAEENFDEVKSMLRAYGPSRNPAVRERVVEALGWFGEKAIVEITPFLGDENEDVRNAASTEWNSALGEIEDEREKATIVAQTMLVLTDPEMLEEVAFHLFEIDEAEAVSVIRNVISAAGEANPAAVAAAKEAYEFVTGDEFAE